MTDFCSIDGRLTPLGEGLPGGVYLYQRLRTVDYRPLHTEAHLSRLRDGAESLFGRPAELPAGRIADEIGALLRANGYPAGGATVTLRLYADGTYALTADGVSLYRTYALRSLRPAAAVVPCDGYRPEWPTSARRETARWAQQEAERSGARCALLCDRHGIVRRAGDAPLFAVRDDVIYAAPLDDVEWTLVAEAARRAGIRWVERPVGAAQLRLFERTLLLRLRGGQLDRLLRRHALSVAHGRTHRRGTGGASRTVGSASAQRRAGSRAGRDDRRFPKNRNTTAARGAILCGKPSYS